MLPMLLNNVTSIHDGGSYLLKKLGGTYEFKGPWLANMNFIATSDPLNVQHVLAKNFVNYPKGSEFKEIFEPFGDGIFNSDSDVWKNHRKMFHQLLIGHSKFMVFMAKTLQQKVVNCLIPFLNHFSDAGFEVDLQEVFQRLTFDNTCSMILGFDPKSLSIELPEVAAEKAFDIIEEAVLRRHVLPQSLWKLQKWLQIGEEKKLAKAWKVFDEFLYQCISSKRRELRQSCKTQKEKDANFDVLTAYLEEEEKQGQAKDDNQFGYSDIFLRDISFNFMFAGRDSVSAGITWFFYVIARYPHVEAKILEEMKENFPQKELNDHENNGLFNIEVLSKLVYFHAAICETFRLFPPIPFNHKVAAKDDVLPSGHFVKKNTRILVLFYAMGRMKKIWGEDSFEFKPERWISKEGGLVNVPSHKFIAFNTGPRSCLGKDMAFIQMKIIAAALLWNFRFRLVDQRPAHPDASIVLKIKNGLKVRVSKRLVH
ncbi:hypothetical protein UlMin_037192 [Ulmus minor]